MNLRSVVPRLLLAVALVASTMVVAFGSPVQAQQNGDSVSKQGPGKAKGLEPTNVQVVPGDGQLTVSWTTTSRQGVDDDQLYHALRWSQQYGVWHNDPMPRDPIWGADLPLPPIHGMLIEPGVTSYTIKGLKNRVATGVHVRSFTGTWRSEGAELSSQWVRVKGPSTTPVADEVVFDSAAYTVAEGGTVSLGLTRYVTAAANLDTSLAVTLATADGTASSSDYTAFSGRSVAMASSVAKATSSVVTASDDLVEDDETLSVSLSVPAESVFGAGKPSTATVTITDDDRAKAKVAFGTNAASTAKYTALIPEGVGVGTLNVPVTVSHLPGASTTFAVEVVPGGTAVEDKDFSIATKSVTFGPTDASKTKNVAVSLINDTEYELDETLKLRIVAADSPADDLGDHYARNAASATAEITVTSEDQRSPTKVYSVGSTVSAKEGRNAWLALTLGETTAEPLAFTVSATYTTGSNKATASDVGNFSSTTHTVAAGKSSDNIKIPLPTDGLVENPETFTVTVTTSDIRWSVNPDGGNTATVTINDNDRATAKIAFGADARSTVPYFARVAENVGTGLLSVPISVNHLPTTPVTFNVEVLRDSEAREGSDYNLVTKAVSFDAANGQKTQNVQVRLIDDSRYEQNETIRLRIVAADNPADDLGDHFVRHSSGATATITITSDESHFAVVSTPSLRVEKGKTATYRVLLTDEPTHNVVVTPQVTSKATVSGPLTFTKDDWHRPQEVTVTGVSNGSATINHQISSDDTNFSSTKTESVSVLVTEPTKLYEITAAATAAEGANAELTVTLSEAAPADMTFNVAYDYFSSTATAADTGSARPTTVTVAKGKTTATLSIPIAKDSLVESAETLKLSIAPGSGVTVAWGKRANGADAATVTINDATIAVSVGQAQFSVGEGDGTVSVPITFSSATLEEVGLRISAVSSNDSATQGVDYRFPSSVTVAQGSTAANFSVTILDDSIRERNETILLRLGVATPGVGYGIGAADRATITIMITITDNDTAGVTVSSTGISVRRGSTATYTVKLNSKPAGTVRIAPTSGDSNKAVVSPNFISFSPSDWNTPKTFTVTGKALGTTAITHLAHSVGDPFYTTSLSIDSVNVTVTTDNLYELSATAAASEGGNADLTVTLHNAAPAGGLAFTVTPAYATGTGKAAAADVSSVPATVTVAENKRTATLRIPIARDALVEGDETFTVAIATSAQGWAKNTDSADTATVTITDLTRSVSLAASSYTVGESDGKVTVGLSVSGAHTDTITATLALANGTAARNADYGGASATAQVTFASGATSATLDIPISDDELVEGSETFTVTITGVSAGHAVGTGNSATVTITDDEAATATVTPTSLSVVEFAEGSYTVSLNTKPTANVTITPKSSAKTHADVSGAVTFTPTDWQTAKTITVTGKQRGSATVTHTVTSNDTRFAGLTPDPVAVTVTPYAKTYAITPEVTVTEGESAVLTITLGEPAPLANLEFVLEYTFDSPAAGKADAKDISDNLSVNGENKKRRVTIASPERQTSVSIPIVADDLLGEGGDGENRLKETFTVSITEVNSLGSPAIEWRPKPGGEDTATVTIQDRDVNRAKIAFGTDAAATTRYTASVAENVSGGTLSVPVTVSHLPAKSTTFTIEVASTGTATAYQSEQSPGDYRIATKSVTFGPTDASKTKNLVITLTDDDDVETAETIVLSIAAAANPAAKLSDHYARNANGAAATITINSDDVAAGSTKTYSLPASVTAAEGTNAELTVTLGEDAPAGGVKFNVTYNYSGSAATSRDTGTTPTTLTVESGTRTATLLVPIARDSEEDDAETFTVTVVASTPGWAKAPTGVSTATVTITDATEEVNFAAPAYTVIEGENANILITRTGAATDDAQVTVTAYGRGLRSPSTTVTIPAGANSATAVLATSDNQTAQARGFVYLSLRATTNGYVDGGASFSLLYIEDDDGAAYTTTYTINTAESTLEADEGQSAVLKIVLGENAHSDGLVLAVHYDYSETGTATAAATAADLGEAPTTLSVAAGANTADLTIPIAADDVEEENESFTVRITPGASDTDWALAPSGSASATVTIKNVSGQPTVALVEKEPLVAAKSESVTLSFGSATIADVAYTVGAPVPYPHDTTAGQERHKLPAATGSADIAYSATGLPAGLVMGRDRIIRGTPTEATTSPVTVTYTATYGEGQGTASASLTFQVTVNPPITFDVAELRPFTHDTIEYTVGQDTPISMVLPEASGGTGTLTYHLGNWHQRQSISGYVEGFSFDAATRTLTSVVGEGSPTTPGRYPLHYWAEDNNGAFAAATTELSVAAAPSLAAVSDKTYTVGGEVSLALPAATGGSTRLVSLRYSLAPEVPGLSFDPLSRTLSGTAAATGSVTMTYTATDRNGVTATQTFTVTVNAGANPPTAAPGSVQAAPVSGSRQAMVFWGEVTGADDYIVQVAAFVDADNDGNPDAGSFPHDFAVTAWPDEAGYEVVVFDSLRTAVIAVPRNGRYAIRVAAVNAGGPGPWTTTTVQVTVSSNSNLSALAGSTSTDGSAFSGVLSLSPSFDGAITAYTATVANGVTHVRLTPTVVDTGKATVQVGPSGSLADTASGSASTAISLNVGVNEITVRVTAYDGITTKDYTVTITRAAV